MAPKTNTKQKQSSAFSSKGLDPFVTNTVDGWTLPQSFTPSEDSKYFSGTNGVNMTNASYYNDINLRGLGNYYQSKQDLMTSNPSNSVSNIVTKASTDSLNNNLNNTAMAPETAQASGPMSYLGETWDKISGGASSLGGWFKDTFGPTKVDRSYANYLSNAQTIHNPLTADQASTINGLYKDGMTADQVDAANKQAINTYDSNSLVKPMTEKEFNDSMNDQQRINNQQWQYGAQTALGLGNLGLGVMSYLGQKDMNDKNMQLIDQQLANNNDLMSTRKARAADISKAFGSGSAKTI